MSRITLKVIIVGILLNAPLQIVLAQKTTKIPVNKGKKYANVGFAYNLVDFDPSLPKKDSIYGFSAMYWQGLSKKFDIAFRYNGIFSNKINNTFFSPNKNRMSSEFELSLSVKALRNEKAVNPFLTGGIGIGNYKPGEWVRYELGGAGLQINFGNELYLLIQANYRYSLNVDKLPHNTFYSIGLTRSIHTRKKTNQEKPDKDKDAVPDDTDACPEIPGLAYLQGCPDRDKDSIADKDDKCPDEKGVARFQGCPVPDRDKDGVSDEVDKCPDVPGVDRYNGCPIPDTDKDGINDEEDKCPNQTGSIANQGCPSIPENVKKKVSTVAKSILFVTGSADLQSKSFKGLDDVVTIMNENPDIKLSIEGHTDSVGTEENNQALSEKRAASVRNYIISKGIDQNRIKSGGFGESKPITTNNTALGRQRNRRVELLLTYYQ